MCVYCRLMDYLQTQVKEEKSIKMFLKKMYKMNFRKYNQLLVILPIFNVFKPRNPHFLSV